MKKDKKFLLELEQKLNSISRKKRDAIILKYRNIIDEKVKEKNKIKDILKEIGTPSEVAQKEINELKKDKKIKLNALKEIGGKTKNGLKKVYNGITKDIQVKPKKKKEEIEQEKKIIETELKEIKIKPKKISKKELSKKIDEEDKLIKERIKKALKEQEEITEEPISEKKTKNKKNKKIQDVIVKNEKEEKIVEEHIEDELLENEESVKEEKKNKFSKIKEKLKKKKTIDETNKLEELDNEEIEEEITEKHIEDELLENEEPVKEEKKNKFSKIKEKLKKKKTIDETNELEEVKEEETIVEEVTNKKEKKLKEETILNKEINNQIEDICEITEIISDKPKYMSKKDKTKKMIIELLGVVVITVMLFMWMWISVVFLASLFAFLDGIKLYGVSIAFLGLDVLFFWITIMINRWLFKKKNVYKTNLIIIISSVGVIALGIALFIYQTSKIEHESDVTLKYSMTTKYDTYKLPSKEDEKMYIFFNSNYDTQYMVKYDENLDGKFKLEVKYYENYYDYNVKKSSNNLYVSLSVDPRDRISSYIDDFKDNKIYNTNELARYTVKITISEKDYQRLVIEN